MKRYRKKLKRQVHSDNDRWLVSYADYMTLMFALFVVLYATAIVKEQPFSVLSESLGEIFQLEGEKDTGTKGEGILTQQVSQSDEFMGNNIAPEKGPSLDTENLEIEQSTDKKLGKPLEGLKYDLDTALSQLTENGLAELEQTEDWLTIELRSNMLFGSGSATASNGAQVVIEQVARILSGVNNRIEVRGYTDNQRINNEIFSSNWQLSAARAASVTNMLQNFGIDETRLTIVANGANGAIASNSSEQGRAQNRRVVIALSKYTADKTFEDDKSRDVSMERLIEQKVNNASQNYDKIQVIKLPNGGVRITTRKSQGDKALDAKPLEKENNPGE